MKYFARIIHLWSGLLFGSLLVVLGLTGSVLSWIHELDTSLNPGLLQVAPPQGLRAGQALVLAPHSVQAVADMLGADPRYGRPAMIELPERAGDVFVAWYRPRQAANQAAWVMAVRRQVMLDPTLLRITGERNWGEPGLTRPLLMPTLFHIHRYLVAGDTGKVVVAATGVALILIVLSGLLVWWPRMTWAAARHALTVRHGGSWTRFSFQLHRCAGFFMAPVLLVSALSGIYFNMPQWVKPFIHALAPIAPAPKVAAGSAADGAGAPLAAAVISAQAAFPQARVSRVSLPARPGQPIEIRMRQPGELRGGPGATRISSDPGNGRVLSVIDPERARGGDRLLSWMFPLHTGEAFGLAGRIFISLFGLAPLAFFVTGLVVWIKVRRKKLV